jgi:hypothetical protein
MCVCCVLCVCVVCVYLFGDGVNGESVCLGVYFWDRVSIAWT